MNNEKKKKKKKRTVFLKERHNRLPKPCDRGITRDESHADGCGRERHVGEIEHGAGGLKVLLQGDEVIGPGVEIEGRWCEA